MYTDFERGFWSAFKWGTVISGFFLGGGAKDTYHRNKKAFQTCYILAVLIKILLESRAGGLVIGCMFCFRIDGPIAGGRAYHIRAGL